MSASDEKPRVSFAENIAPIFAKYRKAMRWRLDLTKSEDVQANADMIYARISAADDGDAVPMPPPMFSGGSRLTKQQVEDFQWWMCNGFPR